MIGNVPVGSAHPVARQTMTTTDTRDVAATVAQVVKCADAGAEIVRITVQGMQEAKACGEIKAALLARGYTTPLVADIHFAPKVALLVAECLDKIRINPGNFADGRKKFTETVYDDASYAEELAYIEDVFTPLVLKCKERNVAMRIGTNHGSLSARTLSYYGDTPAGMVESAFEFARICRKHDYHNFLFSMKASNPLVMVAAYRLLVHEQYKLGWDYPLHLGVTEAGEGEDGRMKSAIGIGALLLDGLGDTIRVSLTEAPELEMDPCTRLRDLGAAALDGRGVAAFDETHRAFRSFEKRKGALPGQRAGDGLDFRGLLHRDGSVLTAVSPAQLAQPEALFRDLGCKLAVGMPFRDIATSDSLLLRDPPPAADAAARRALRRLQESGVGVFAPAAALAESPVPDAVALFTAAEAAAAAAASGTGAAAASPALPPGAARWAVWLDGGETEEQVAALGAARGCDAVAALLCTPPATSRLHASRRLFEAFARHGVTLPVIHHLVFPATADKARGARVVVAPHDVASLVPSKQPTTDVLSLIPQPLTFRTRSSSPPAPRPAPCWWTAWATACSWRRPAWRPRTCGRCRLGCCRAAACATPKPSSCPAPPAGAPCSTCRR